MEYKIEMPVTELVVSYPPGYEHPDPRMREIMREVEALSPQVEAAKRGTEHEACKGWSVGDSAAMCYCICGAPLDEILLAEIRRNQP